MRQHEEELLELGIDVAVVTFEADFLAHAYVQDTDLKWPLLVDTERSLYHAFGMLNASWWDVWGPSTWWAYAKELFSGARLKESEGDISQRGGDVLVDPNGVVRVHHVGDGPADRPSVESLLAVVRQAQGA